MDEAEIRRRFEYHAPNAETRDLHDMLRVIEIERAKMLNDLLPGESREKSLMFTALEEAQFWAHAHVARNVGREG